MKQLAVFTLLLMFIANMAMTSAHAGMDPSLCLGPNKPAATQSNMMASADMPCHDTATQAQTNNHCQGLCLCLHAATVSTLILHDVHSVIVPNISTYKMVIRDDNRTSNLTFPLLRPPQSFS